MSQAHAEKSHHQGQVLRELIAATGHPIARFALLCRVSRVRLFQLMSQPVVRAHDYTIGRIAAALEMSPASLTRKLTGQPEGSGEGKRKAC